MAKWGEIKCERCAEQDALWEGMERALEESDAREARLEARIEELEAKLTAMSQSREHFKRSAEKQRQRCHNLRHRQRALMAALQNVKDCTSIETAKFVAYIALGGWGDDELVYKSHTTLAELKGQDDE